MKLFLRESTLNSGKSFYELSCLLSNLALVYKVKKKKIIIFFLKVQQKPRGSFKTDRKIHRNPRVAADIEKEIKC